MEIIYNAGPVTILKESGMTFTIYNITLAKPEITIIGSYLKKDCMFTRITKDSVYGKKIMKLLNPEVEVLSQDMARLREITSMLTSKMDMGREDQ